MPNSCAVRMSQFRSEQPCFPSGTLSSPCMGFARIFVHEPAAGKRGLFFVQFHALDQALLHFQSFKAANLLRSPALRSADLAIKYLESQRVFIAFSCSKAAL